MGIPNVNPRLLIIGNGTRGPFDLAVSGTPIRVRTASQLVVRRYSSTTDEDGTLLVLNTDYLVTNTDVDDVSITLTVAQAVLASTERLLVNRTQEIAAVIDLTRGGDFSGPTISAAMSVLSEQLQETRRNDNRSIQVDWLTASAPTLPLPPLTEQAALVRDVDGGISQIVISDFAAGPQGDSAYEVAVNNGYVGTELEWLETLIGTSSRDEQVFSGDAVDTTFVFTGMVITDKLNIMIFVDGIVQRESDYGLSNDGTDTTITFTSAPPLGTNNIVMRGAVLTGGGSAGAVDSVNGQTGIVVLDADDIDDTSTTNKFATAAELSKLAGIATGATVYTDEMARDALGTALTAGTGVTITPNDGSDIITVAVDTTTEAERIRDVMGAALVAGTNITLTVNDAGDTITIDASGGGGSYTTEEAQDAASLLFTPDDGDIDFTYNDATPSITASIKAGAVDTAELATGVKPGVLTFGVPAAAMTPATTNGAAAGTTESTTNKVMYNTLDFDASTQEYAHFDWEAPKGWDLGTFTAEFVWFGPGGTGNVIWGIQAVAISDDDLLDAAFGTAQEVTDGVTATTDKMKSSATSAVTIAGTPAALDTIKFRVYRKAADGSDTLASDAKLLAVRITVTFTAHNDA